MSRLVACASLALVLAGCGGSSSGGDLEGAEPEVEAAVETTTTTTTSPEEDDFETPGPALDPAIVAAFEAVTSADEATIQQAIEQFSQDGRKKAIAVSGAALFNGRSDETCISLDDGDQRVVQMSPDCVDRDFERRYLEIAGEPGDISDFSYSRSYQAEDSGEWLTGDANFYDIGFKIEGELATMPFPLMATLATSEARARMLADVLLVDEFVAYDFGPDPSLCWITLWLRNAHEDKDLNLSNPRFWEYYDFIGSELPADYDATYASFTIEDIRIRAGRARLFPFILEAPCGELYEVSVDLIGTSELDGDAMYRLVDDEVFTLEVRGID